MKYCHLFFSLLIASLSSLSCAFAKNTPCQDNCTRNYSTTTQELERCMEKCAGTESVVPVVTDPANENLPDVGGNPENSGNLHRN